VSFPRFVIFRLIFSFSLRETRDCLCFLHRFQKFLSFFPSGEPLSFDCHYVVGVFSSSVLASLDSSNNPLDSLGVSDLYLSYWVH
jgi:hypothetical protein